MCPAQGLGAVGATLVAWAGIRLKAGIRIRRKKVGSEFGRVLWEFGRGLGLEKMKGTNGIQAQNIEYKL